MSDRRPLELIALPADGWETQFDEMPLAPGIHLRWSFWPELGWPAGGFEVKRRYWAEGEFLDRLPELNWERIVLLARPPAADGVPAAMRAARTVISGSYICYAARVSFCIQEGRDG